MIHDDATPRTLGILRAWVFTIWLVDLLREPIQELGRLPIELFEPLGVMRLLPAGTWTAVLSTPVVLGMKLVLAALLVPLILGIGPYRRLALAAALLLTFWQGLHRGMLGVVHREMALLYVTYVLALFPAADGFSMRRARRTPEPSVNYQAPMVAAVLVFALTYVAVGIRRVLFGGPDIFTDGTILRYLVVRSAEPGFWSGGAGLWVLSHPLLALAVQVAFPIVTLFEILSPLVLFSQTFRLLWIAVMLAFHFICWGSMQIFFLQNVLLMPVLLLELDRTRARDA